jgi:P-type Cu+ transporter
MQAAARNLNTDFSSLDQADFRARYAWGINSEKISFYIQGISCAKCVRKLEGMPESLAGLKYLRVEMGKNVATAEIDPSVLSFSGLAEAIIKKGFTPIPLLHHNEAKLNESKQEKSELIRLAVAGACAGNIMTFSFAVYFGADPKLISLFSWLSFALYLPVLTYVALPFYRGALNSFRLKQLSIDLPMAVASLAGFLFSTIELIRGKPDIYFDSLSGFLFLILVSRWMQNRLQKKYLRSEDLNENFKMQRVRVLQNDQWSWVPLEKLNPGDQIELRSGETVPCEGEMRDESGYFGLAWLTGESKGRLYLKNSIVPAGAVLQSEKSILTVKRRIDETSFGQTLNQVRQQSLSQNRVVSASDKWAQILLITVFSVAGLFLIGYWAISPEEAIRRSLALIVLACPCAMAFGTPLALASAVKRARRKGLIIRDANVFEKLKNVRSLFLDKTGTLTESELSLVELADWVPDIYKKIILSLENVSCHPIAFAFRKAFSSNKELIHVEQLRENPGKGVSGYIYGRFYELRACEDSGSEMSCALFEDHKVLLNFHFKAKLIPQCLSTIQELRNSGYQVNLLSGDKRSAVESFAAGLGFKETEIFFEKSPEEKAQIVQSSQGSLMFGDGSNDALSLMQADVAIAASGSVETSLKCADVYCVNSSIQSIYDLFEIGETALRTIQRNLWLSLIYNSVGGVCALLGFINPLVAALLMPLSSGLILLSTWLGGRK